MNLGRIEPVVYVCTRPIISIYSNSYLTCSLWFSGTIFVYFIIVVYMKLCNPYNKMLSSLYIRVITKLPNTKDLGWVKPKSINLVFVASL